MGQRTAREEIRAKLERLEYVLGAVWGLAFVVVLLAGGLGTSDLYGNHRASDGDRFLAAFAVGLIGLYWWRRRALWRELTKIGDGRPESAGVEKAPLAYAPPEELTLRGLAERMGPGVKLTSIYLPPRPGDKNSKGATFHADGRVEEEDW